MKRKSIALFALAFALVLGMAITPAGAYFTDRSTANGGLPITVEPDTNIYEWVKGAQKHIVVTNAEGSAPVFVRVQVDHPQNLPVKVSGDGWEKDGDWYVYQDAVVGGGETTELLADIDFKAVTDTENPPAAGTTFNVTVFYEAVDAKYKENGDPDYGDWKRFLEQTKEIES